MATSSEATYRGEDLVVLYLVDIARITLEFAARWTWRRAWEPRTARRQ
jgi:hypothetical protein